MRSRVPLSLLCASIAAISIAGCRTYDPMSRVSAPTAIEVEFAESIAHLERGCTGGDAEACMALGRIGQAQRDLAGALPWFWQACEAEPQACVGLGDALIGRRANASNPALAFQAFSIACDAGHAGACYELGVLYYLGLGVDIDDVNSAALHSQACSSGVSQGCAYMAHLHRRGFGVERDPATAQAYRDAACDAGDIDSCGGRTPSAGTDPNVASANEANEAVESKLPEAPPVEPHEPAPTKPAKFPLRPDTGGGGAETPSR